ncbi:MAG: ABC transporter substrate-binding protein [Pseudomonadota bacterium]
MINRPLAYLLVAGAMAVFFPQQTLGQTPEQSVAEDMDSKADPGDFIVTVIDDLKALVVNDGDDPEARRIRLSAYLSEHLSVERMSRFVLSQSIRQSADPVNVETYDAKFEAYITAVFGEQLDQLVTRRIEIDTVMTRKPGDFIVRSVLFDDRGRERAKVDWRVLDDDGQLRLVDVIVEGISVSIERRAQFSALVSNQGFDALLDHMQDTINGSAS